MENYHRNSLQCSILWQLKPKTWYCAECLSVWAVSTCCIIGSLASINEWQAPVTLTESHMWDNKFCLFCPYINLLSSGIICLFRYNLTTLSPVPSLMKGSYTYKIGKMNRARRDTLGCTRCEGDWAAILTWRHMVPNCATTLTNYPPSEEQADPMNFVYDDIPLTLFFEAPSGHSSTASSSYLWPKMHSRLEEEEQLRRCWQLLQNQRRPSSKSLHIHKSNLRMRAQTLSWSVLVISSRGERIVFWWRNTNTNIIRVPKNDRIQIRILFGFPKLTEYEYEYYSDFQKWPNTNTNIIRLPKNDQIRIRILLDSLKIKKNLY